MAAKSLAILGSRGIPARYGGFETFAEELSVRLAREGVDVTVFCQASDGEIENPYKGVNLEFVKAPQLGVFSTLIFDFLCLLRARGRYDVVYMLGYGAAVFCFIPRMFGSTVWINPDGVEWLRSKWSGLAKTWFRLMEWFSVRIANRIIADAEAIREFLVARHGELRESSVIAYGAPLLERQPDDDWLQRHHLIAGRYDIVVCRLEPENHVLEIISGYLQAKSAGELIVVGGIENKTEYVSQLLADAGDKIRFVGAIYDQRELQSLRFNARYYFHGHSVGGTNPSLIEAMGAGNIVVAHDNPFNREVLGTGGRYFSNADDLTTVIDKLSQQSDSDLRQIRDSNRRRIREYYTWENVTAQYLELLSD
jgi:glycosyltransferase involved in cell wall biosynthesis